MTTRRDSRPFVANFGGACAAECGDPIKPGEDVQYLADELMHVECAGGEPPLRRPEPAACPSCHLVHAGECW